MSMGGIIVKWLIYFIFLILFLGVTFFGLGPVLLADGSMQERMLTLLVVILIYAVLAGVLFIWHKKRTN